MNQIEAEQEFSTHQGIGRALAMLSPMTRKFLSDRYENAHEDFSELPRVFTNEVPNTKQQASFLLRAWHSCPRPCSTRALPSHWATLNALFLAKRYSRL